MKWDDGINQKPSDEFRNRVLMAARPELESLKGTASNRRWFLIGGLSLTAALAVVLKFRVFPQGSRYETVAMAFEDQSMFEEAPLLNELELFEDLDVLEQWKPEKV